MNEHIHTIKALQPDVLPESEYLPVYATFQSYIALYAIKTRQKRVHTALQNSKTHASSMATQILRVPHTGGLHPLYAITKANTFSVYAVQRCDSNLGQITMNKEIKTIHEWQYFTNMDYMSSLVAV